MAKGPQSRVSDQQMLAILRASASLMDAAVALRMDWYWVRKRYLRLKAAGHRLKAFPSGNFRDQKAHRERLAEIKRLRAKGWSQDRIGKKLGISRWRVGQLLSGKRLSWGN